MHCILISNGSDEAYLPSSRIEEVQFPLQERRRSQARPNGVGNVRTDGQTAKRSQSRLQADSIQSLSLQQKRWICIVRAWYSYLPINQPHQIPSKIGGREVSRCDAKLCLFMCWLLRNHIFFRHWRSTLGKSAHFGLGEDASHRFRVHPWARPETLSSAYKNPKEHDRSHGRTWALKLQDLQSKVPISLPVPPQTRQNSLQPSLPDVRQRPQRRPPRRHSQAFRQIRSRNERHLSRTPLPHGPRIMQERNSGSHSRRNPSLGVPYEMIALFVIKLIWKHYEPSPRSSKEFKTSKAILIRH